MFSFVRIRFCLFSRNGGNVSLVNKLGAENVQNFPSPHVVSGITGGVVVTKTPLTVASVRPLSNSFEYLNSLTAWRGKRNADRAWNQERKRDQSTLSEEENISPAFSSSFIALICQIIHTAPGTQVMKRNLGFMCCPKERILSIWMTIPLLDNRDQGQRHVYLF